MIRSNPAYDRLQASYLFADIAKRVSAFEAAHPERQVIRMGIGDVTEPLPLACREAFKAAVDELGTREGFRGYGPSEGYDFIREAIVHYEYASRRCEITPDEVFLSDGSKCDGAALGEIFARELKVAVPDPVYPVYVDANVMDGRTGGVLEGRFEGLTYLESTPENGYRPELPNEPVDLIVLISPNNPTGAAMSREELTRWVDYARAHEAVILYDAAYEAYIRTPDTPHSIYEIPGARECAIELRSFSKNAGFTGVRCAWTVVPKALQALGPDQQPVSVHGLWDRRHSTRFNGVSYPVQRAAEAVYSDAGQAQVAGLTEHYLGNAALIRKALEGLGIPSVGGVDAPYVWAHRGGDSWAFFDRLLNEAGVVCTPGAGFGRCGEGHVRFSAFNTREKTEIAMERLAALG